MLLGQYCVAQLPGNFSRLLVDDAYSGNVAETEHHPVAVQGGYRVAVAPLVPQVVEGDDVAFRVQVLRGMPLPHPIAAAVNFHQDIRPHALGIGPGDAALDRGGLGRVHQFNGHVHGAAFRGPPCVVMMFFVVMLPDHVALPVGLQHYAALEPFPGREPVPHVVVGLAPVENIAVREQVPVKARRMGQVPAVDFIPLHVHQVNRAVAGHGSVKQVTGTGAFGIAGGQPRLGHAATSLLVRCRHFCS